MRGEKIFRKSIKRGILQGDSLSPLLFVLCIEPLSRQLNALYPKVHIETKKDFYICNHLLFIDDIKIFTQEENTLSKMTECVNEFLSSIGLEINTSKTVTNSEKCHSFAMDFDINSRYKYLGIIEDRNSKVLKTTFENMRKEILHRVENLCKSGLNSRNLFSAINEYALSLINYFVGVIPMEYEEMERIDIDIRKILVRYKFHFKPANKERLYLPRKELGRGLGNIVHRSEIIEYNIHNYLSKDSNTCLRKNAILQVMKAENSSTFLVVEFLKSKYNISTELNVKTLKNAQKNMLYTKINEKSRHRKLLNAKNNELVDITASSKWLEICNINPRDEANLAYLQDRNVFGENPGLCSHCRLKRKTVDHLATQCIKMLGYDYKQRHNEVIKCIHLFLCNKYGIKNNKRLRNHSVQEINANENVEIRIDTTVSTTTKQKNNRPDIIVLDKKKKEIIIIEVGITCQDNLNLVEKEKKRKYDILAKELELMYNYKSKIIPYVITWDGIVTKFHKSYAREIGLGSKTQAYIQYVVLKRTLESISIDHRRGEDIIFINEEKSIGEPEEDKSFNNMDQ